MSLKSDILAASKCPEGEAELVGHKVRIRGMSAAEEVLYLQPEGIPDEHLIAVCAACIIDDKGKPLFSHDELSNMTAGALAPVIRKIVLISFPDLKDTEKN